MINILTTVSCLDPVVLETFLNFVWSLFILFFMSRLIKLHMNDLNASDILNGTSQSTYMWTTGLDLGFF